MDEMNNELYQKISYLQWLLHKQQLQNYAAHGPMADPTRGQGRVLAMLQMHDGISTKDLSYLLGIRIASLNELLAKLEKAEYITREPSEADKRVMMIRLTQKGKNEKREETDLSDIFACLSAEDQDVFGGFLDRIIHALEEQVGDKLDEDALHAIRAARERMGEEMFNRLHEMRRGSGGFGPHDGSGPHGGFGSHDGSGPHGGFGSHDGSGPHGGFGPHDGSDPHGGFGPHDGSGPRGRFDPHQMGRGFDHFPGGDPAHWEEHFHSPAPPAPAPPKDPKDVDEQ